MTDPSDETKEARERLEHQADATRARLMTHLDTLDDRRDRAKRILENVGDTAKRHKTLLIGMGVGVLVAAGLIAFVRRRNAKRKPGYALSQAVKNLLGPGYVIESVERRNGLVRGALTKAGLDLAVKVANEIGKRHVPDWLDRAVAARGVRVA